MRVTCFLTALDVYSYTRIRIYIFPFFSRVFVASWTTRGSLIRPIRPRIHRAISKHRYSQTTCYCSGQTQSSVIDSNRLGTRCFACFINLSRNNGERKRLFVVFPRIFQIRQETREHFISVLLMSRIYARIRNKTIFVAARMFPFTAQIGRNRDKNFREIRSIEGKILQISVGNSRKSK